jgi:alpha-beta hydrolase superfamily lysophospholipase
MGNIKLYQKNYIASHPRAAILLIHGLHEHCERYHELGELFQTNEISVYTFDLRGHGKSEGEKHFISSVDEYVEDVKMVFADIPKNLPLYVLGHSMGGLIAVNFLLANKDHKISGLILSGAALKPGKDITPFKEKLVRWLAVFFPKLKTVPVKPELVSRDKNEVNKYKNDPMIPLHGAKAGLGVALLNSMDNIKDRFSEISIPTLIMHGEADQLTDPDGSKIFFNNVGSQDKTLQIWPGCYHEIFNEINKSDILDYTLKWVEQRI